MNMNRGATVSTDDLYRYQLWRAWDESLPSVRWLMLNPSTADAAVDDPTIRKCIGFSQRWGFGSLLVVNLYAFRATDPRELVKAADPVGPLNDAAVDFYCGRPTIVAWGGGIPARADTRVFPIRQRARRNPGQWFCLGRTKSGEPRHPLMLAYDTPREPWPA